MALITANHRNMIGKSREYMEYIDNHIKNVQQAFRNLFFNPVRCLADAKIEGITRENWDRFIERLEEEINNHDLTKYSDMEFYDYRQKYYPTENEKYEYENNEMYRKLVDERYEAAWQHHYYNNYHHPKFWKAIEIHNMDEFGVPIDYVPIYNQREVPLDMTVIAILHMICDWEAMSIKFNSSTIDWYKSSKSDEERRDMSPNTRKIVKQILEYLYDVELSDELL